MKKLPFIALAMLYLTTSCRSDQSNSLNSTSLNHGSSTIICIDEYQNSHTLNFLESTKSQFTFDYGLIRQGFFKYQTSPILIDNELKCKIDSNEPLEMTCLSKKTYTIESPRTGVTKEEVLEATLSIKEDGLSYSIPGYPRVGSNIKPLLLNGYDEHYDEKEVFLVDPSTIGAIQSNCQIR